MADLSRMTRDERVAHHRSNRGRQRIFTFKDLEFWAERGLIHVIDMSDGSYNACSITDFMQRRQYFMAAAEKMQYADERARMGRMTDNMKECCRQATQQGDPTNAKSRKQVAHDKRYISYVGPGDKPAAPAKKLILPGDPGFK